MHSSMVVCDVQAKQLVNYRNIKTGSFTAHVTTEKMLTLPSASIRDELNIYQKLQDKFMLECTGRSNSVWGMRKAPKMHRAQRKKGRRISVNLTFFHSHICLGLITTTVYCTAGSVRLRHAYARLKPAPYEIDCDEQFLFTKSNIQFYSSAISQHKRHESIHRHCTILRMDHELSFCAWTHQHRKNKYQ